MKEQVIQHKLVMWFSQQYPDHRGLLFSVNNDTFGLRDAQKRKAMGLISGVSDLCLIVPELGKLAGIELKAPQSKHSKDHIKNQLDWGMKIIQNKGFYIMTSDLSVAKQFIFNLLLGNEWIAQKIQVNQIHNIQDQFEKSTIIF